MPQSPNTPPVMDLGAGGDAIFPWRNGLPFPHFCLLHVCTSPIPAHQWVLPSYFTQCAMYNLTGLYRLRCTVAAIREHRG